MVWLKAELAQLVKIDESSLDSNTPFGEYGVDSILIASLIQKLEHHLNISLDPSIILEFPTLKLLSQHLAQKYGEKLKELVQPAINKTTMPPIVEAQASIKEKSVAPPKTKPVAVIGLACHFPGAQNQEVFWQNLSQGICSIKEVPKSRWNISQHYSSIAMPEKSISKWGGFIDNIEYFDPGYFGIAPEDALYIDPLLRQCLEVAVEALKDAGYHESDVAGRKAGVFIGSRVSNYSNYVGALKKNSITGLGQNFIAAMLAHVLNLTGPNLVVDTACSSSLVSIHLACQSLRQDECELAFAGGADILLDEKIYIALSQAKAFSPDGKCHTFDEKANGFVPGEGCGIVILKLLDKALADGDRIYGIIEASAVNNDGKTMGVTTPNPHAQQAVIEQALQLGDINPQTISYVETHGTGTLIGDPIELKALSNVFTSTSNQRQHCAVGSVKTNIGHLLSAAGVASFIKVMLALTHKQIPATLHCHKPNPRFSFIDSPFFPMINSSDWIPVAGVLRAGISSFGFGGTNAHAIVREFDKKNHPNYRCTRNPLPAPQFAKRKYWAIDYQVAEDELNENSKMAHEQAMKEFFEFIE